MLVKFTPCYSLPEYEYSNMNLIDLLSRICVNNFKLNGNVPTLRHNELLAFAKLNKLSAYFISTFFNFYCISWDKNPEESEKGLFYGSEIVHVRFILSLNKGLLYAKEPSLQNGFNAANNKLTWVLGAEGKN